MKTAYPKMTMNERQAEYARLKEAYQGYVDRKLNLNMARGKPSPEQLDETSKLIEALRSDDYKSRDGRDLRNYSGLESIPEINDLFAELLHVDPKEVIVYSNGSLGLMYSVFLSACLFALPGADEGWYKACGGAENVKVLCPSPGYDRHFAISEKLGCDLIATTMTPGGPDMDEIEALCQDPNVKALWLVPIYANPTGSVCAPEVYERLAKMKAAPDFRIFIDHAYGVHHLTDWEPEIPELLKMADEAGNPNRFILFASTSKISFASAGIAGLAASKADYQWFIDQLTIQSIGADKIQQLRHVRFFEAMGGIKAIMAKHRAILAPKFEAVLSELEAQLSGLGIAEWSEPKGGYFVSVDLYDGCASRAWQLCKEAGVTLTGSGATYPYGKDPHDSNIRLAPSFPPLEELETAIEVFCVASRMAALEKIGVES